MNKHRKGKNCIKNLRVAFILCMVFLALAGSTYVYAKYYSVSSREGIAIATGVYFTANYAAASEKTDSAANVLFPEFVAEGIYTGGSTEFVFEIRNYENNLLFNGSNVTIPYTLEFWLGSSVNDGTEYSVSGKGINKQVLKAGEENKITISGQNIQGGAALSNPYTISITVPPEVNHKPIPIYVRAKTSEGSLINRTLTGKILLGNSESAESFIESNTFTIPGDFGVVTDEEKYKKLQEMSLLIYEIRTAGTVSSGEVTEKIKIIWNPEVLQIDLYDSAYLKWQETTGKKTPDIEENGNYSIVIDAMPYAAENIGFFRGVKFAEKATDWTTLHQFIAVEKYTEQQSGI